MIYLIGDLHLGHKRICEYTNRPFNSVREMDKYIIHSWNACVKDWDMVICLGDFAFGDPVPYLSKLKGYKVFIKGNHDKYLQNTHHWLMLGDFLLIHKPFRPFWWDGWVVHGHVHNKAPFFDIENKMINVSVEVIGYSPIDFETIKKTQKYL